MTSPIDLGRASVRLATDGAVVFSEPGAPWTVRVWTWRDGDRTQIRTLQVHIRDPAVPLSSGRLAALPLAQLRHLAAREETAPTYPNEDFYRMLAQPKPAGRRQWDDGHWERVLAIHDWGKAVGYRGGPRRAVAVMYEVSLDPTVNRWLAEARRRRARAETRP